jgi:hypothetical protein
MENNVMLRWLFLIGGISAVGVLNCRNGSSSAPQLPTCVVTVDALASADDAALIPSSTVTVDWGGIEDPDPTTRSRFGTKQINGMDYGGEFVAGSGTTSTGVVNYRVSVLSRRLSQREIEAYVSSTLQGEVQFQHAPHATVIDAATGAKLAEPYRITSGELHLIISLPTSTSQAG